MLQGVHPHFLGLQRLVAHIDLAGRILAHQHDGEPRHRAARPLDLGDGGADATAQPFREGLAVDDVFFRHVSNPPRPRARAN
jgi:hypothetical protein